jgi:integrase
MSFGRRRSHVIPADRVEESTGKAIPIDIQRQLDANIDTSGGDIRYGTLNDEQRQIMFATAYILLRDTGRRTAEIASLKAGCLARDSNGPIMIYDNHKAGRLGRRLPILESTAEAIQRWHRIRTNLANHDDYNDYLFPGEKPWEEHMDTKHISLALRAWVRGFDRLDANELDKDGHPVPFDRMRIFP